MATFNYSGVGVDWVTGGVIPVYGLCTNENLSEVMVSMGLSFDFGGSGITYVREGSAIVDVTAGRLTSLQVDALDPAGGVLTVTGLNLSAAVVFDLMADGPQQDFWAYAFRGADVINGTAFRDRLAGYGGNDLINGKAGNDILLGGAGKDTLIGGDGGDKMIGGADADVFILDDRAAERGRWDEVADLDLEEDSLHFSPAAFAEAFALCTNENLTLAEVFRFGAKARDANDMFLVTETERGVLLSYDADANGAGKAKSFAEIVFTVFMADGDTSWIDIGDWSIEAA